jgi:heptosyltransferase-2
MSNNKVLVVAPAWIGDLIISSAFINALKKSHRDLQIDLLVNENLSDIAMLFPNVTNIIISKTTHGKLSFFYRLQLGFKLRRNNYSKSYILTNSFKSAIIPFIAGIKDRISYLGEYRYGLVNRVIKKIDRKKGMVNRYLNILNNEYTTDLQPSFNINDSHKKIEEKYSINKKYIVICPDAEYGPAKKWPVQNWVNLACNLITNYQVVFVGLDTSIKNKINSLESTNIINLIGKTSLKDVVEVLSNAKCVVSNDSGLMHLSSAVDVPIVGIYGSSSPKYTPPLCKATKHEIIYKNLDCSPCFKRECPLGHTNCLNDITVDTVLTSIGKLTK